MNVFPEVFDVNIYREKNIDLKNYTDIELKSHYVNQGRDEGRISGKINYRTTLQDFLQNYVNSHSKCLEIGPFDCPVLTGNSVK